MTLKTYFELKLFLGAVALLKIVGSNIINNNVETEDIIHNKYINQDEGNKTKFIFIFLLNLDRFFSTLPTLINLYSF